MKKENYKKLIKEAYRLGARNFKEANIFVKYISGQINDEEMCYLMLEEYFE